MAVPGLVHVKVLRPVQVTEAQDRRTMAHLVRKRMLESLLQSPLDTCRPLHTIEKVYCHLTLVVSAVVCTGVLFGLCQTVLSHVPQGWSIRDVAIWSVVICVGGTFVSFVYCVYIQRWTFELMEWVRSRVSPKSKISLKKDR